MNAAPNLTSSAPIPAQRQISELRATFPGVRGLLGEMRCERLMLTYTETRPCTKAELARVGAGFVEHLAAREDVPSHVLGVARLEWALVESLLAPEPPSLAELPRGLGIALAECRLELVPSLRVEHVPRASLLAFAPEQIHDATAMTQSGTIDVAFWRPHFAVIHVALEADEARAHALARGGATIGVVCAAFSALPRAQAAERALTVLSRWFARSWVASCQL